MAKEVGTDQIDIHSIVPVGTDPHEYEVLPEDIKKASPRDKAIIFGTLYDKERLERGQSTVNLASIYSQALESRTPDPQYIVLEPDRETGTGDNDADSGG